MKGITREMADRWKGEIDQGEIVDPLLELIDALVDEPEEATGIESEKDIRIKYQEIVYAMCNELDGFPSGSGRCHIDTVVDRLRQLKRWKTKGYFTTKPTGQGSITRIPRDGNERHNVYPGGPQPKVIEWEEGFYAACSGKLWLIESLLVEHDERDNGRPLWSLREVGNPVTTMGQFGSKLSIPTRDQLRTKIGTDEETGKNIYAWAVEHGTGTVHYYPSDEQSLWDFMPTVLVESAGVVVVTGHQRTKIFNGVYPPEK